MSVTSVSSTSDVNSYTSSATGGTTLGKEDFLTILIAQLENQDPLDPQDSAEFIAQMAQFSSLEQQIQTNENLATLIDSAATSSNYAAFQLLGNEVVAASHSFSYQGESVELGCSLDTGVDAAEITVLDANDEVVATLQLEQNEAGVSFVGWDGTGDDGTQLASGDYTFAVTAVSDGEVVEVTPLVRARVTQVSLESSAGAVVTDAGEFGLADITSVAAG